MAVSMAPRTEHFLALPDGRRLHYVMQDGPGRTLLLLHGIAMTWAVWQGTLRRLAGHYRLVVPDLRGHGESDWLPPRADDAGPDLGYEPPGYGEDIARLLDQLQAQDTAIVGSSLGGLVALTTAVLCPTRVAGLCLVDPPLGYTRGGYLTSFRELREAKPVGPVAIARALGAGAPGVEAAWVQPMVRMVERVDPRVLAAAEIGRASYVDLTEWLPQVRQPVLLMRADPEKGAALTATAAERACRLLPNARLVDFPGAGHAIHATQAAKFIETLTAFVDGLPAVGVGRLAGR